MTPSPDGGLKAVWSAPHLCLALYVMGNEGTVKPFGQTLSFGVLKFLSQYGLSK